MMVRKVILKFERNSLPKDACVTSWTLRLYVKGNADLNAKGNVEPNSQAASYSQEVTVYPVKFEQNPELQKDSIAFGKAAVADRKLEVGDDDIPEQQRCKWLDEPVNLGFDVESGTPGVEYQYYGLTADPSVTDKWSNTILEAGEQINFQRGFSVPVGAQLSCRIQSQLK